MAARVPCKSPGCNNTVQLATAKDTGGYCMPCVGKRKAAERAEFIRKNRVDVDPYKGVSDPAEILKIMFAPRKPDPLVRLMPYPKNAETLCAELNVEQIGRLIDHAVSLHKTGREHDADLISLILAAFAYADLGRLHQHLVSIGRFYPGVVFHGASDEIQSALMGAICSYAKENSGLQVSHILQSLAWSGSNRIVSLFADWKRTPPSWSSMLHVKPDEYSKEAGWELDGRERRDLYFQECYALEKTADTGSSPVSVVAAHPDTCEWCNRPMTTLFDLDMSDLRLSFINANGRRISVASCDSCANFGTFFSKIGKDGRSSWHKGNVRPQHLPEGTLEWPRMPEKMLALSSTRRRPFHAGHQFLPTTFSQIGGHPTWIQDAEYPSCPDCKETMVFVAQLSVEDIEKGEGIYYAFVCFGCMNGAVSYQQT